MSIDSTEFDFLELPAGGVSLEEDPFGYAPAPKKTTTILAPVLIPVTDATIGGMSERFLGLRINGITDTAGLAKCKDAKKECVRVRNLIETSRTELKKPYLDMGKKIDAEAKRLQELLEPTESYITLQVETVEKSLKKIEQERLDRVYQKRKIELDAINLTLPEASVRAMTDEEFANLIERSLQEFEEKQEESRRRAEEQRQIDAERAKQKAESDRLAAERAEMQRKQDEQNAELARQREELAAQQRQIDRQLSEAARAEKDRLIDIERERVEEQNRIAKAKQLEEAKARAEKMRPFSEQLLTFADRVQAMASDVPKIDPAIDETIAGLLTSAAGEIRWIAQGMVSLDSPTPAVDSNEFSDI